MRLLVDTDAFCKLAAGGLLDRAAGELGARLAECARLPALPSMLRRGKLFRRLGSALAARLQPIADTIDVAPLAAPYWLDQLTCVSGIDPGEAQLLARAAEAQETLVTGDKRALRALRSVASFTGVLAGRVVLVEAILLRLCAVHGDETIRQALQPALNLDTMLGICFSSRNPSPSVALRSYFAATKKDLDPLVLWSP